MSVARFIFRSIFFVIALLAVGLIAVFGFLYVVEPMSQAFGDTGGALGGANPGGGVVAFTALGLLAMLLFLAIWYVYAPIRRDKRQEVRR